MNQQTFSEHNHDNSNHSSGSNSSRNSNNNNNNSNNNDSHHKAIEFLHLAREKKSYHDLFHRLKLHESQAHYFQSSYVQSLSPLLVKSGLFGSKITEIPLVDHDKHMYNTVKKIVQSFSDKEIAKESFFIVDLSHVIRQIERWKGANTHEKFKIRCFYAVKCNPNENIVKLLYLMGCGFDCASKAEIEFVSRIARECDDFLQANPDYYQSLLVSNPGATLEELSTRRFSPSRDIIYANPCKEMTHIQFAAASGVVYTTLDSVSELEKISKHWKNAKGVLRIITDDSHSSVGFSSKFGVSKFGVRPILQRAKELGVELVGISFHVGTSCMDETSYVKALHDAFQISEMAVKEYGFNKFHLIDIGGGFIGKVKTSLPMETVASAIAPVINEKITDANTSKYLNLGNNDENGLIFLAEPGRYIAAASHTLVVNVHTKKDKREENRLKLESLSSQTLSVDPIEKPDDFIYYVDDGIYGSFNNIVFDHCTPIVNTVYSLHENNNNSSNHNNVKYPSTIFGPTCDSLDIVAKGYPLPELQEGDFLFFNEFGAYTIASSTEFNGFKTDRIHYITRN